MRKIFAVVFAISVSSLSLAVPGGLCGQQAGCGNRSSYNSCLNCCSSNGCGSNGACDQFCWNVYRRFKLPGNPATPPVKIA